MSECDRGMKREVPKVETKKEKFINSLKVGTKEGMDNNIKVENAWNLKRIADKLTEGGD